MTPDAARALAAHFQERCDQMGPDHPETSRLGRLVSAVVDLASQVDALTPPVWEGPPEPVDVPPPKKRGKKEE